MEKPKQKNKIKQTLLCSLVVILTLITIGIGILLIIEIRKSETRKEMECQALYLREINIKDESLDSIANFIGDEEACIYEIESKIKDILDETKERMNEKTNHRAVTICIEKKLTDFNYSYQILLLEIVDFSRISWKIWKYFERTERHKALKEEIDDMELRAFSYCDVNQSSSPTLFESSGNSNDEDEEYEEYEEPEYEENSERLTRSLKRNDDFYFD